MQHSRSRLSIFAIISALEADARVILRSSASEDELSLAIAGDIKKALQQKAEADFGPDLSLHASELIDFTDFGELPGLIRRVLKGLQRNDPVIQLCQILESLIGTRNRVMHNRPLKSDDYVKALRALESASAFPSLPLSRVFDVRDRLEKNPNYVLELEIPQQEVESVLHNLPLPDFDDTGLIGRESDSEKLKKLLLSPRSVISIIGEGGVGKSAVTVSVLYDLLDDLLESKTPQYEGIIWTTLKTKALTASGIRILSDQIVSTVSVINAVQSELGLDLSKDVDRILEFMRAFPMILIIDNLETINAGPLRDFFRNIPEGSKIVITSRIGLGEFEERYVLEPLSPPASVSLMRRAAENLNVQALSRVSNQELAVHCDELSYNPLAIKWFVGRISSGARPKAVAREKRDLLEFCFENIYETFGADERQLLEIFTLGRRPLTFAELDYFSEQYGIDYVFALNKLLATSVIRLRLDHESGQTEYALTDFSAEYLRKFHSPDTKRYRHYLTLANRLAAMEQDALRGNRSPFDPARIAPLPDNRTQQIAGAYLKRALLASAARKRVEAFSWIERAKNVAPEFLDVYRIAGFIYGIFEEVYLADDSFREGLAYGPDDVYLLLAYAQFLIYKLKARFDEAADIADKAVRLNPCPDTLLVRGRAYMFLGRYREALADFDAVLVHADVTKKHVLLALDQGAAACKRQIEELAALADVEAFACARQGYDYICKGLDLGVFDAKLSERAFGICSELFMRNDNVFWPPKVVDHITYMLERPLPLKFLSEQSFLRLLTIAGSAVGDSDGIVVVKKLEALRSAGASNAERQVGIVTKTPGKFGFIMLESGEEVFFPFSELQGLHGDLSLLSGHLVTCCVVEDSRGKGSRVGRAVQPFNGPAR